MHPYPIFQQVWDFTPEQDDYFIEINLDGLLRGDILSGYRGNWGWLSTDEVCEFENFTSQPDRLGKT
jgi:hypothetical protein